jgi:hypothetical protein
MLLRSPANLATPRKRQDPSRLFIVHALSVDSHGLIAGLDAVTSSDRSYSACCDCMRALPPVAAGNMNSGAIIR